MSSRPPASPSNPPGQPPAPGSGPEPGPPLAELRGVGAQLGGRALLSGVNLRLERGEALLLSGPNGGGKTSLLRLLAGEIAPTVGERVYGLGGQIQRSAVQARRRLALVGPDAEAFYLTRDWEQSVRDVLLAGLSGERLRLWEAGAPDLARLAEVAGAVGLTELLDRDVRSLSHGQRRRCLLGRALMPAPELLLLDEFTDGLSPAARAELGAALRRLWEGGVALVLATHRPEEAPALPWRRLEVRGGRVRVPAADELGGGKGEASRPTEVNCAAPPALPAAEPLPAPPLSSPQTLVLLERAEVYRNGHRALGPLTWRWERGQHWLVTGENGSGKSTLARLIAGEFHPALGGQVQRSFLPRDLLEERRRATGLVSAELGIRQRRDWDARAALASAFSGTEGPGAPTPALTPAQTRDLQAWAERLGVTELLDRPVETLSQGQWRRVLLARAVLHRPILLLLDEGLDFLDEGSRARFLAELPGLIASGTHLLVVAHRPEDAPAGLTHHLRLAGGRAVYAGPRAPDRPFDQP